MRAISYTTYFDSSKVIANNEHKTRIIKRETEKTEKRLDNVNT